MKKLIITAGVLTLVSCASMYRQPESIQEKMARYKSKKLPTNPVPHFVVNDFSPSKSRFPASAKTTELNYSNKNIYFLSLYEQYEGFTTLYPQYKREIKHCPVFHQVMISYKETPKKWSWKHKNPSLKESKILSSIKSLSKTSNNAVAIKDHMNRNHSELSELCERGASDNYYIYENMITLSKDKEKVTRNNSGLNSLLKTTLFFNEALLHDIGKREKLRIKGRGLASTKKKVSYTQDALVRIRASWAKSFYLKR